MLKSIYGPAKSFQSRFHNYKSGHRNFMKGNTMKQVSFHTHFEDDKHGISDWEITFIDQTHTVGNLRRRDFFFQYELNTFQFDGLNAVFINLTFR